MSEPVADLGRRLRDARVASGLSLREVARQLGVSPAFISRLEHGKSQPSLNTLHALGRLLAVSLDQLLNPDQLDDRKVPDVARARPLPMRKPDERAGTPASEPRLPPSSQLKQKPRISVSRPGERPRLEMTTGVVWERLADSTGYGLDFVEVIYPAYCSSTNDGRTLQHHGMEFGYVLEGELEVTVGSEVVLLRHGDSIGFDPTQPYLIRNCSDRPARGIWCVQH